MEVATIPDHQGIYPTPELQKECERPSHFLFFIALLGGFQSTKNLIIIRKIWTDYYIGTLSSAPKMVSVPSVNQYGGPSGNEIVKALENKGYSSSSARDIANGGWTCCWCWE